MTKAELRRAFLNKQKSLAPAERSSQSERIVANLFAAFDFSAFRYLHCFVALEKTGEVETARIFEQIRRDFPAVTICAPRVNFQTNEIESAPILRDTKLVANKWQILEPQSLETIEPQKFDAVLTPLVAFDRKGFRVGYGKGFYDRFLKNCRADCRKIGLSFFPPVEKIADAANFDVKLDACATPESVFYFN